MQYIIILLFVILSNTRIWGISVKTMSLSPQFKTSLVTSSQWDSAKEYGLSCFVEPHDLQTSIRTSIRSLSVINKKDSLTYLYTPFITQIDLFYPIYEKSDFLISGVMGYLVDFQEGKWSGFYVGLHSKIKSKSDFSYFIEPGIHQQQLTLTLGFHQPILVLSKNDQHHSSTHQKKDANQPIEKPVEEAVVLHQKPLEEKLLLITPNADATLSQQTLISDPVQNKTEEKKQFEELMPVIKPDEKKEEVIPLIVDEKKESQSKKYRLFESVYLQNQIKSDFLDTHRLNWADYAIRLCTQLNLIGAFREENPHFFRPYEELSQRDADKLLKGIASLANQNNKSLMLFSTDAFPSRLSLMKDASILLQSLGVKKSFQTLSYVHYQDWIELSVFDAYDLSPYIKTLGYGGDKDYKLKPKMPILRSEAAVIGQKLMLWAR